jgi:alanine dehydrogenase
MTQLNKVYKLSPNYQIITQEENKFKFNEEIVLKKIKDLCKNVESIEKQQEKMDLFINAVSIVARKDLIAQYCSFDVLIYSGNKLLHFYTNHYNS